MRRQRPAEIACAVGRIETHQGGGGLGLAGLFGIIGGDGLGNRGSLFALAPLTVEALLLGTRHGGLLQALLLQTRLLGTSRGFRLEALLFETGGF